MYQLTLGKLIDILEAAGPDRDIRFSFCRKGVVDIRSWRGDYSMLALSHTESTLPHGPTRLNIRQLLEKCRDLVGRSVQGYKGGDYQMHRDTPIWVDDWGRFTETAVMNVEVTDFSVILHTIHRGYVG